MSEQMSEQGETLTEALANLNDQNIKDAALPDNKKVRFTEDISGVINFYYELTDDRGGYVAAYQSITIHPFIDPNQAPYQIGPIMSFPELNGEDQFTIYGSDLLVGYGDPDGDDISIGLLYTDYGYMSSDPSGTVGYLPISPTESLDLILGEDSVTFTVPDS